MGMMFEYPAGATPLDPDDARALLPSHITTREQLNDWEQLNVTKGELWAFGRDRSEILSTDFIQALHKQMFGDTWGWAGTIRSKEILPIGSPPEKIRSDLANLWQDVTLQLKDGAWTVEVIAARVHHRLVSIHPFPNGNGRFSRTMTDLLLVLNGKTRFTWGIDLVHDGKARQQYLAALRAADAKDYGPLFGLLGLSHSNNTSSGRSD